MDTKVEVAKLLHVMFSSGTIVSCQGHIEQQLWITTVTKFTCNHMPWLRYKQSRTFLSSIEDNNIFHKQLHTSCSVLGYIHGLYEDEFGFVIARWSSHKINNRNSTICTLTYIRRYTTRTGHHICVS